MSPTKKPAPTTKQETDGNWVVGVSVSVDGVEDEEENGDGKIADAGDDDDDQVQDLCT